MAGVAGVDPHDAPAPRASTGQPVNRLAHPGSPASQQSDPAPGEPQADASRARGSSGPTITPFEDSQDQAAQLASADAPASDTGSNTGAVFLKQNGQIYMVSDWETLKRWIAESRVDRHDLVSEGGVRWEPIGSRPDLLPAFTDVADPGVGFTDQNPIATGGFGGETPFGGDYQTASGWHDDDTEGIPTGLPPLPTDEVRNPRSDGPSGFDAVNVRRHMTPTPPPVGRRRPPPVQRPSFVPPPPPEPTVAARMGLTTDIDNDPSDSEVIVRSPEEVDTARPHPLRDNPPVAPEDDPDNQATAPGSTMRTTQAPLPSDDYDDAEGDSANEDASFDEVDHPTLPSGDPTIAPPALPDTVPPPPVRAAPQGPRSINPVTPHLERETTLETEVVDRAPVSEHDMEIDFYAQNTDEILAATRRSNAPLMFAGCFVLLAIAAVGLILVLSGYPGGTTTPQPDPDSTTDVPDPGPALPDPTPVPTTDPEPTEDPAPMTDPQPTDPQPTEDPEPSTEPQPTEDPQPSTAPQPAPQPGPLPEPPRPGPVQPAPGPTPAPAPSASVARLITQGWKTADSDPADAISAFEQALAKDPDNVDAHYGYGYALLKSGNSALAKPHLCIARDQGDRATRVDVRGILSTNGLSCE